jgi:hypothetical protein
MAGEFAMGAAENKKLMQEIFAGLANRNGALLVDAVLGDPAFPAVPFHIPASA